MFKKAGIVVGVTIILLACGIFWFVNNMDKEGAEGNPAPSVQEKPNQQKVVTEQTNQSTQQPANQTGSTGSNQQVQPQPSVEQKQVFSILDESELGNPFITRSEVMVVAKKKLVLMDSNFGEDTDKQLVYAVDLLYGDKTMTLYLNGVAYKSLKVGDKLKVDYSIYKNDKGVEFPIINSVEQVQ